MTTDEVILELEGRGFRVVVEGDEARLRGDRARLSPNLLAVLRWHKGEIIERLRPPPRRQWLWRTGHRYTAEGDEPATWHPVGAWWYRLEGEAGWRHVDRFMDTAVPMVLPPGEVLSEQG